MITRRTALAASLAFPANASLAQLLGSGEKAIGIPDGLSDNFVPNEAGQADFANAFELIEGGAALVADVPDIPQEVIEKLRVVRFRSFSELNRYFNQQHGDTFNRWFNANLAGRSEWKGKAIKGNNIEENFREYWTATIAANEINLIEFIAYMSVFINECEGGNLASVTERFGRNGHEGLAYLFDSFQLTSGDRVWRKKSYNSTPDNTPAGTLFSDGLFNQAHGDLPLSMVLMGSTHPVWMGVRYPQETVSTSKDPNVTGYVQEADFVKFRGRGLIQTTWRANYKKLVPYIQSYNGTSLIIRKYAELWKGLSADSVCTKSTNRHWDELFSDNSFLYAAIRQHAQDGRYLPLQLTSTELNGGSAGSLRRMGDRIGGTGYGQRLKARARQICLQLT